MVESASEKLAEATTLPPARSGWVVSMPVSSTATFTPLPVSPADQAAGALTWVRLGSRSTARKRRSSHTLLTPARGPGGPGGGGGGGGQGRAQLGRLGPWLAHGGGPQAGELAHRPQRGGGQGRRPAGRPALHDQGEAGRPGVAVAHPLQLRDVEQVEVEHAAEQAVDVGGDHMDVAPDGDDLEAGPGPRRGAAITCTEVRPPAR